MRSRSIRGRSFATLALSVLALVAASLSACSSSSSPADTTCQSAPAEDAVAQSRTAMAQVKTFHFNLTHPVGSTAVGGGLTVSSAEGSVVGSDRLQIEAEADFGRLFVKVQAIVIGDQTWMTNPLTGNWNEIAPGDSPFGFLDPPKLVSNILGDVTGLCYYESDQSKSGPVVVKGTIASEALSPLVGAVEPDSTLDVTMWFDRDTHTLTKARIAGKLQTEDEDTYVRQIELSDFDSAIDIEPPL